MTAAEVVELAGLRSPPGTAPPVRETGGVHQPEARPRRTVGAHDGHEADRVAPWDELLDADGDPRPAAGGDVRRRRRLGRRGAAQPPGRGRRRHPHDGHHVHGVLRRHRHRPGVAVRRHPAGHRGRPSGRASSAASSSASIALNRFIDDLYNDQQIVADGVFPADLLDDSANFRPECRGVHPQFGVWAHISGSDLVRDADGTMYVLEDNLRVPSGVSYVLENRAVSKRAFAEVFARQSDRPGRLLHRRARTSCSCSLAPDDVADPSVAVLTPGHLQLGLLRALVPRPADGRDARRGRRPRGRATTTASTCARSTASSRSTSSTGASTTCSSTPRCSAPTRRSACPGLMRAWKAGTVAIANAPGAGVADDKVVYAWVPDIIRYYLGEEPLIANVPTYRCLYDDERRVRARQPARARAQAGQRERRLRHPDRRPGDRQRAGRGRPTPIEADPRNWVAQPILQLSTARRCATTASSRATSTSARSSSPARRATSRPAASPGSRCRRTRSIVNSSQGGGSKDTWIVDLGAGWGTY